MWQPIPELFCILLRSSINKYGDKIPPCRTPFETLKKSDVVEPHLIQNVWVLYQYNRIRISTTGTPRLSNFLKSVQWLTLSNAFKASRKAWIHRAIITFIVHNKFFKANIQWSVECPFLNPNWLSVVPFYQYSCSPRFIRSCVRQKSVMFLYRSVRSVHFARVLVGCVFSLIQRRSRLPALSWSDLAAQSIILCQATPSYTWLTNNNAVIHGWLTTNSFVRFYIWKLCCRTLGRFRLSNSSDSRNPNVVSGLWSFALRAQYYARNPTEHRWSWSRTSTPYANK